MLRFAANLSMMFTELPFRARFAAARMAGFAGVEFLFPYAFEPGELRIELDANGLKQALFNLPPGDWEAGERGMAALPGREAEFEASVATGLEYAEALNCRLLHVMAGIPGVTVDPDRAMATYIDNLRRGAAMAAERSVTLIVEPINRRDMPGYFLSRCETARRVIDAVGADNLGLQFDVYHRQVTEGDIAMGLREFADLTRHIQVANPPDRADPGAGEINYPFVFDVIEETGYSGWIGCEYRPRGATRDSLAWFEPYRVPRQ